MKTTTLLLALFVPYGIATPAQAQQSLSTGSLLNSLVQVQDKIASGDATALPLQTHLMKLLDGSIGDIQANAELSEDEVRALMIFGIVGVGSNAVVDVLRGLKGESQELFAAIVDYRQRRRKQAIKRFKAIDLDRLDSRVAPFVAFALGNLLARQDPAKAVDQYNHVRLLAPGTLLEEVTLRRLLALYLAKKDGPSFIRVAKQYARRFLSSPYREQYLSALRTGIMLLHRTIPRADVAELASLMPGQYAAAFYMHMIRSAVIAGHLRLAGFGVEQIVELVNSDETVVVNDSKLELLREISRLSEGDPTSVHESLASIDEAGLQPDDRSLLIAARKIVGSVVSPIDGAIIEHPPVTPKKEPNGDDTAMADAEGQVSSTPSKDGMVASEPGDDENIGGFIEGARKRLEAIDKILSE